MNSRKLVRILSLIVVLFSMLACTIFIGGPDYPGRTIPVSTEAVGDLRANIEQAITAGAVSGTVSITITEPQLTSYLAMKLQLKPDPLLTNPQVYLQDGQIQIFGTIKQGYFQANAAITMTAGVDDTGQLSIKLSSADFGPLPVPAGLLDGITALLEEAFTGSIGPVATGIRLTDITIADGEMVIVGFLK
jgi:hypothetical protein